MATPAHNTLPQPILSAPPPRQSFLYKSIITLYRVFAIVVLYAVLLYAVLLGILAYAFIMGFYAINTTWAAPVIISSSDEKVSTSWRNSWQAHSPQDNFLTPRIHSTTSASPNSCRPRRTPTRRRQESPDATPHRA